MACVAKATMVARVALLLLPLCAAYRGRQAMRGAGLPPLHRASLASIPVRMYAEDCWKRRSIRGAALTEQSSKVEARLPGAGMNPESLQPFQTVLKDGYFEISCSKDYLLNHGDKFGDGKDCSSSSTARPRAARGGGGASGGDETEESDAVEDDEPPASPGRRKLTALELEERGKLMASKLERVFSNDAASRTLGLLKQKIRTQKEQAASCLVRQMEAIRRHAQRVAMARWMGATIVIREAGLARAEDLITRPVQVNSWGQRAELLGLSSGPVRANISDGFQQHQQVMRRSRSLVASQLARHVPDLQEYAQRPNSSSGSVPPPGTGRPCATPFICDVREGFMGRAYLGRPGLVGRGGQLSSSRLPWECPTALQAISPKLAHACFEQKTDPHDQTRAVHLNTGIGAVDQVKTLQWNTVRLARDKRLQRAGSSSSLIVTGGRPGQTSNGLMQSMATGSLSMTTGSLGHRIHGRQAS